MTDQGHVRAALVTGAGRRLGAAIAEGLARAGYELHLHAHTSVDEAEELAEKLASAHAVACHVHTADFSDSANVTSLVESLKRSSIAPTLVVNCASVFTDNDDLTEGIDGERLMRYLRVNAVAPIMLANIFLPGESGHVVNVLDSRVDKLDPTRAYYGLSKALLSAATAQLARVLAPAVRVNGVAPGLILPPEGAPAGHLAQRAAAAPMGTPGHPDDVVRAILYLEDAGFVTGDTLYIDGGEHL